MEPKYILLLSLIALLISAGPPYDIIAQDTDDIVFEDTKIQLVLHVNGTTIINFKTLVKNSGLQPISTLTIRVDVRSLIMINAAFNDKPVEASIVNADRYSMISITLSEILASNETGSLEIDLSTRDIQEEYSLDYERSLSLQHIIFYIRPTHLIQHLSVSIALPPHAVLDTQSSSLIYPTPSQNHTDGTRMVFTWDSGPIFPGQESVFIVKFGLPITNLDANTSTNSLILPLSITFILGALSFIITQRLHQFIKSLKMKPIHSLPLSKQDKMVLEFIIKKGGSCSQRVIYEELDMSQSMTSMILSSLEERGLIRRLREGRMNMVHIIEE